jgi:peptidoglycan/LPS O-acetylase OafA/YrhL
MKYNPALDGVRAIAVLAVVGSHAMVPGMYPGMWGVDVFFVLSGYLITSILKDEAAQGGIRFGQFYLRRIRRLYPALLTMLALYLAIFPWFYPGEHLRDAAGAALYLSDYAVAFTHDSLQPFDPAIGHTWSLSVEEHFYLLWPAVVAGLALICTRRFVVYLLAAAYLASTVYRLWSHVAFVDGWWETYYRFDTRTSGLLLGALLAYLPEMRHRAWALAVLPLGWATWAITGPDFPRSLPTIPAEWCGAALVLWAACGSRLLGWRPLAYIGSISYGVYLYHWPVAWVLRSWDGYWWQTCAVTVLVAFTLAHFSHRCVESYFRRPPQATSDSMDARMLEVSAS